MSSNSSIRLLIQALVIMAATSLGVVVGVTLTRSDNSTEAGAADAAAASGPQIEFEMVEIDFGRVFSTDTVEESFRFKNVGTEPLVIDAVDLCCGVTLAESYERTIPPGGTGSIAVRMRPNLYQSAPFRKTITVRSNDPDDPMVAVVLKGTIAREFDVQPPTAAFNIPEQEANESQEQLLQLINNTEESIEIVEVTCADAQFSLELATVEIGKRYDVRVTATPPFQAGTVNSTIEVTTNHPDHSRITIPAYLYRQSIVSTVPMRVALPVPLPGDYQREILVRHGGGLPLEVTDLQVTGDLTVRMAENASDRNVLRLLLSGPEGYEVPEAGDQITFHTDEPTAPEVSVLVIADPLGYRTPGVRVISTPASDLEIP